MNSAAPVMPRMIFARFLLFLIAVVTAVSGCAHQPTLGTAPASYLWQSGDQFVALVAAEQQPGNVSNDHPVSIDQERLGATLATLGWQESTDVKPVPLFTDYETSILAEQIRSGLARAAAGEEVVFALVGNHPAFMGLAKRPQVTTGRVFHARGRLHLILGMVHGELGKNDDRRLQPFVPGSRETRGSLAGTVIIPAGVGEKRRADWLVIDPAAARPEAQPGSGVSPAPAADAVPAAGPGKFQRQSPPTSGAKQIEERLLLLNGLKEKGLVTDEEYRAKRREILNDL